MVVGFKMQGVEYMKLPSIKFEYLALVLKIEDCTKIQPQNCHDKGGYMNILGLSLGNS